MIEIKKSAPNDELVQIQKEAVQKNYNADDAYELLRNPLKACVIEQLMADQGHLCAYCMRKIPDERKGLPHVKIEHWYPRNGINGITAAQNRRVSFDVISGHFATSNSHVSAYIDMNGIKSSFRAEDCEMCKAGKRTDAIVNSFGYSKL